MVNVARAEHGYVPPYLLLGLLVAANVAVAAMTVALAGAYAKRYAGFGDVYLVAYALSTGQVAALVCWVVWGKTVVAVRLATFFVAVCLWSWLLRPGPGTVAHGWFLVFLTESVAIGCILGLGHWQGWRLRHIECLGSNVSDSRPPFRYTLRDLFLMTTVVSICLGAGNYLLSDSIEHVLPLVALFFVPQVPLAIWAALGARRVAIRCVLVIVGCIGWSWGIGILFKEGPERFALLVGGQAAYLCANFLVVRLAGYCYQQPLIRVPAPRSIPSPVA